MINIGQLTPRQVGEYVTYTDGVGDTERGRLKSFTDTTVYVVFKCGDQWDNYQNYTGQGCSPADLVFIDPAARRDNCIEHYYLQHGIYQGGKKCQSCGDEIGTKW